MDGAIIKNIIHFVEAFNQILYENATLGRVANVPVFSLYTCSLSSSQPLEPRHSFLHRRNPSAYHRPKITSDITLYPDDNIGH